MNGTTEPPSPDGAPADAMDGALGAIVRDGSPPGSDATLRRLVQAMPKAELHLHLDGSLRPDTALELARTRRVEAPADYTSMSRALVAPARCASQAELLDAFDLPVALLQDEEALERVAAELVEAKAADRVRYVEVRWAPGLHEQRGLPLHQGIAAVVRGAMEAGARTGTAVRLICTALRSDDPARTREVAEAAGRFRDAGLTGFDLAGREESHPDPLVHRRAFEAARAAGLRITVHAGEWGGAGQVQRALALDPERIAHGPGAIESPGLCAELSARNVTLDLCPTSNVQAGIVPAVAVHPLRALYRRGVPVTLSTDGLTVADVTLSGEYVRAVTEMGLSASELWAIDLHALDVAFADEGTLAPLRASFRAWGAWIPELADANGPPDLRSARA